MPTITPYLWFNDQAEEAANFYASIFPDSKIHSTTPGPEGKAMIVNFSLNGQEFIGLNGGPTFQFTEAVSFLISVETQQEVDDLWEKLTADGGVPSQCGWLKDKYGLSWQVIPKALPELLGSEDREAASRAMQAMLGMQKIDIAGLQAAADAK
jgi:predicted 3-demethylubiquinone-9 3-methyltransferase (glyoxalase superfamily)